MSRRGGGGMVGAFDAASMAQAFARPGIDPRQWVSMATVDADTDSARSVQFTDEDGNPNPYGPLVSVTLQPSGICMVCRVASAVAGDGEADWYPFVGGDEVAVLILEGDERAGGVIVGRMNQEIDKWPLVVGGQDATKNTFGFRRMRCPFIVETVGGYLIRSALTGSQIGIDPQGKVILSDGDQGNIVIGPDAIGMTSGDGETFMQLFPADEQVFLGGGPASLLIDGDESKFISTGIISFNTSGSSATGMGVTAEQVVCFIANIIAALAVTANFNPAGPLGAAYAAGAPANVIAVLTAALAPMAAVTPFGVSGAPGGMFTALVGPILGPAGAVTAASANPVAPIDPTGSVTGFGRGGFKL